MRGASGYHACHKVRVIDRKSVAKSPALRVSQQHCTTLLDRIPLAHILQDPPHWNDRTVARIGLILSECWRNEDDPLSWECVSYGKHVTPVATITMQNDHTGQPPGGVCPLGGTR